MNLQNIDVEKHYKLEDERAVTMADPSFQNWVKELNISQSYEDPTSKIKANLLNEQYDFSISNKKGIMSLLNLI